MNMGGFANMAGMTQQIEQAQREAAAQESVAKQSESTSNENDPDFVEDVAAKSQKEAQDAASDEIVNEAGRGVRQGFGKLFGR